MPIAVANDPAMTTLVTPRATCRRATRRGGGRRRVGLDSGAPVRRRRQTAPADPTRSEKRAALPATPTAIGRSAASPGMDATAAKAKIRNNGPGGCHDSTSEIQEPTPATSAATGTARSEEHTSELQPLMRISYADFCLKQKIIRKYNTNHTADTSNQTHPSKIPTGP